jgi:hypothetical protein
VRDEIRRLIGTYATGSLTEAERKTLYEAALEDQELFDELAGEHAFKELLEEPGAKQRLIAAVSKAELQAEAPSSVRAWRWGAVALAAASVFIAIIGGRMGLNSFKQPEHTPPVETARVMSAPPPRAQEPAQAPVQPPEAPARTRSLQPKTAAVETPEKPAQAQKEVRKEEPGIATGQLAIPSATSVSLGTQPAAPGVGGGAPPRAAASFRAALMRAPRFAFEYTLEPGDILMIKSAAPGYLRVTANSSAGAQVIFPAAGTGRVAIDSVNRLPIPASTQELVVTLSAQPAPDAVPGLTTSSENRAGTIEDPNPSADSKLVLTLRVHY